MLRAAAAAEMETSAVFTKNQVRSSIAMTVIPSESGDRTSAVLRDTMCSPSMRAERLCSRDTVALNWGLSGESPIERATNAPFRSK